MRRPTRQQYVFLGRRDRQRIAQRLGSGLTPEQVAAAERTETTLVFRLLTDRSFVRLVEHYRELHDLPMEARLERLTIAAMELLELAVTAGDYLAGIYVTAETRAGRNPARTLAGKVLARVERAALERKASRQEAIGEPSGEGATSGVFSAALASSPPEAETPPAAGRPGRPVPAGEPAPPPIPPGTSGPDVLEALESPGAGAELARRLAATARRLQARLLGEAERRGTASPQETVRPFAPPLRIKRPEPLRPGQRLDIEPPRLATPYTQLIPFPEPEPPPGGLRRTGLWADPPPEPPPATAPDRFSPRQPPAATAPVPPSIPAPPDRAATAGPARAQVTSPTGTSRPRPPPGSRPRPALTDLFRVYKAKVDVDPFAP